MLDNSRNYSLTRKSDTEPLSIIRETTSDTPNVGSSREYGKKELLSGVGHTNSSTINKDYR